MNFFFFTFVLAVAVLLILLATRESSPIYIRGEISHAALVQSTYS